jgi:hypothetical protein
MKERERRRRKQMSLRAKARNSGKPKWSLYRPVVTEGKHREFYNGTVPPWDESLGDFICYEGCCGKGQDTNTGRFLDHGQNAELGFDKDSASEYRP